MAEKVTSKGGHRLEEVVAYHDGRLPEAGRAEMERHLAECAECRDDLKAARLVLPALDGYLATREGYSTDELLARMRAKQAELDREGPRKTTRTEPHKSAPMWPWLVVGGAVAAGAAALLVLHTPAPRTPVVALVEPVRLSPVGPAPTKPGTEAAPSAKHAPAIPVEARVEGNVLSITARREPGDRYAGVVLLDVKGGTWLVEDGAKPDPTCTAKCGPLRLQTDVAPLPPGPLSVIVTVSAKPAAIRLAAGPPGKPSLIFGDIRALGQTGVAR